MMNIPQPAASLQQVAAHVAVRKRRPGCVDQLEGGSPRPYRREVMRHAGRCAAGHVRDAVVPAAAEARCSNHTQLCQRWIWTPEGVARGRHRLTAKDVHRALDDFLEHDDVREARRSRGPAWGGDELGADLAGAGARVVVVIQAVDVPADDPQRGGGTAPGRGRAGGRCHGRRHGALRYRPERPASRPCQCQQSGSHKSIFCWAVLQT